MVRKFFIFVAVYLLYMMVAFGVVGLLWKFAFEAGWTKSPLIFAGLLLLLMILVGAPPAMFSSINGRPTGAQKRLLQTGQEASAQILEVANTGLSLGDPDLSFVVRLTLWVQPTSGESFQGQIETSVSHANVPRKGETVRVKFDPKHRDKVVLVD